MLSGTGWNIKIQSRGQHGSGPLEIVLQAKADTGEVRDPHDLTVQLKGVRAQLYHEGLHTATITAPIASANQKQKTLIAEGGVTVTSLTDPPDTVVTSDKLYWNAAHNELVAEGHARAVMRTHEGGIRSTTGDRLYFDTKLKEIRNE